jgi:hypothetical protein
LVRLDHSGQFAAAYRAGRLAAGDGILTVGTLEISGVLRVE